MRHRARRIGTRSPWPKNPDGGRRRVASGRSPTERPAAGRGRVAPLGAALAYVAMATLAGACGYALAGRGTFLPPHIQTIGVPLFTNSTPYAEVDQLLTDQVRREFIGRGRYRVVPERAGVDAILEGQIVSISVTPASFTSQQLASRYVLTLVARVTFRDLVTNKVLWENPAVTYREEYDVATGGDAADPRTFVGQHANALRRIADEFARGVVSAILEAF